VTVLYQLIVGILQQMPLPKWPPTLPAEQLDYLTLQATTYALAHGLLYLPPNGGQPLPPIPASAIHAPFALFPTPFPKALFERANRLQHIYNVLYARVASDDGFLDGILNADTAVGRVDEFVGSLWRIWKDLRDGGPAQVSGLIPSPPLSYSAVSHCNWASSVRTI
jgi:glutathione synthase